jgi:MYXO-CTERM domain-containing protein
VRPAVLDEVETSQRHQTPGRLEAMLVGAPTAQADEDGRDPDAAAAGSRTDRSSIGELFQSVRRWWGALFDGGCAVEAAVSLQEIVAGEVRQAKSRDRGRTIDSSDPSGTSSSVSGAIPMRPISLSSSLLFAAVVAGSAFAAPAEDAPAPGPGVKLLRVADKVPGEYVVVLKGKASSTLSASAAAAVDTTINSLASKHNAEVGFRYTAALLGFSAKMSEADALALAADPSVAFVEENGKVYASATVQNGATWGLDRIDQQSLPLDTKYTQLGDGEGSTIFIVDTGVLTAHTEFTGRLQTGYTAIPNDGVGTSDCQGHGSHVGGTAAGTTYGVAKKAKIVPVRVLNCEGSGTNDGVIAGIDYVARQGATVPRAVANMSLGGQASALVDAAVAGAVTAGVVMVVAAGNDGMDACLFSPARAPTAVTVGATRPMDERAQFSNFGTCVDLFAPGVGITSAWYTSATSTNTISGTSMAAPHVAGVAAAYRAANPSASAAQVAAALTSKAYPGKVSDVQGAPNLLLNSRVVDTVAPVTTFDAPGLGKEVEKDFTVTVTVNEANLASVAFSLDGDEMEIKTVPPFTFEVNDQDPGVHTLMVVARDLAGQSTTTMMDVTVAEESGCSVSGRNGGAGYGLLLALAALLGWRRRRS